MAMRRAGGIRPMGCKEGLVVGVADGVRRAWACCQAHWGSTSPACLALLQPCVPPHPFP